MPVFRDSFGGSLAALLATIEAETLQDKELPLPPGNDGELYNDENEEEEEEEEEEDEEEEDYDPDESSESLPFHMTIHPSAGTSATAGTVTPNLPTVMTKRMHALLELLTSERAYASDLALIRDIHIPLALGQPAPFNTSGTPPTPPLSPSSGSGSSSRTVSTASDSSTTSSQLGPPMTRDDVRIIFGNISDLALFSDRFVERLEEALGGVLEGGSGEDTVGALFLEIIPVLEPPYKTYITRHPTALAHLNTLPRSPALSAYLSHTRALASSLTHAWDLSSLLIKPVQRLLKYSLLLGAIINSTPDSHGDRAALVTARAKMEEVARSVNEDRRRWEVVREVLGKSKKGNSTSNVAVGIAASAHLGRMRSLRGPKLKDFPENSPDNAEAVEVARLEGELQKCSAFLDKLAKDVRDWRAATHASLVALRQWGITFGGVLGLKPSPSALDPDLPPEDPTDSESEGRSEAYDAFTLLLSTLPGFSTTLEQNLQAAFPPTKLLGAMHSLEPLHVALLHTPRTFALRSALSSELPVLLRALNRATGLVVRILANEQTAFYEAVGERWAELWDALKVEGERCGGADETLRVWWERWEGVDVRVSGLKIVNKEKWWAERERDDTFPVLDPVQLPHQQATPTSSHSKRRHHHTAQSRRRSGSTSTTSAPTQMPRRPSDESLRSGKSAKSVADPYPVLSQSSRHTTVTGHNVTKSNPTISPLRTTQSVSSQVFVDLETAYPPSPSYDTFEGDEQDRDGRGRPQRRSSLKSKLTDTFRPSHHRRRSSSVKSLGAPSSLAPTNHSPDVPLPPYSPSSPTSPRHIRRTLPHRRRLTDHAHRLPSLLPVRWVSYRNLPFFPLVHGDLFDVLREYGHPSTHVDLPLYVDDGEDCLLLVRARSKSGGYEAGEVGWALASFLVPID
ncbi:hypothetical protein BU15DRAFT_89614 [Melanogaster broomeanus]|nr:hypothetical protein BU15DRAFT_89614 [Melanogaster broomeanus]